MHRLQASDVTIDRVIDARAQFIALSLAMCPPQLPRRKPWSRKPATTTTTTTPAAPHPPTAAAATPNCGTLVTHDVVRLIGQKWILKPERTFILNSGVFWSSVVTIGATLGVISTQATDAWTKNHHNLCWLGTDRILAFTLDPFGQQESQYRIMDVSPGSDFRERTFQGPVYTPSKWFGGKRWVLAWRVGELFIRRAVIEEKKEGGHSTTPAEKSSTLIPIPSSSLMPLDVVFSNTEPSLIGNDNEASILETFNCNQKLMTVDLEKSFLTSTLVVVKTLTCSTPPGTFCNDMLFMDEKTGESRVVYQGSNNKARQTATSMSINTGETTFLSDTCQFVIPGNEKYVRLDGVPYNVFTGQVCPHSSSDLLQTLLDRGLLISASSPGVPPSSSSRRRSVIDADTGCVVCHCPVQSRTSFL